MLGGLSHSYLAAAAADSLKQIQRDYEKAPPRIQPLLAYIEKNLFDPNLDVNQLKRSCGVRDNSIPIQFHSSVGRPPHGYIEDRRLETACRLLAGSPLKVWQIAELLGYSSIQVFSRAFSRWSGQRPTTYRRKERGRFELEIDTEAHTEDPRPSLAALNGLNEVESRPPLESIEALRKALVGQLPAMEANGLIGRLLRLYPAGRDMSVDIPGAGNSTARILESFVPSRPQEEPDIAATPNPPDDLGGASIPAGEESVDSAAAEIWQRVDEQPPEHQPAMVGQLKLTSPAFIHLLRRKSREAGARDPRRGVEIAELALIGLDTLTTARLDNRTLTRLRAQTWAWLGNAQRLASDYASARRSLETAEGYLRSGGYSPLIEAEVYGFRASLHRDQQQFDEARELLSRALDIYRQHGRDDQVIQVLQLQASVSFEEGDPTAALPYFEEAKRLVTPRTAPLVLLQLYHNLALCYAKAGHRLEASQLLPRARELAESHGQGSDRFRSRWVEALVLRELDRLEDAEAALLAAHEGFANLNDPINAALIALDLASLYAQQNRTADLRDLSATVGSLFDTLRHHREAITALRLFHRAVQERSVSTLILDKTRQALQLSRRVG